MTEETKTDLFVFGFLFLLVLLTAVGVILDRPKVSPCPCGDVCNPKVHCQLEECPGARQ